MTSWVMDGSVTVTWLLGGASARQLDQFMDGLARRHAIVPSIWRLEVANGIVVALRRGTITTTEMPPVIERASLMNVEIDHTDVRQSFTAVLPLAIEHGLSIYDAAYLELAIRTQRGLASLDRPLVRAAQACGVPVLDFN